MIDNKQIQGYKLISKTMPEYLRLWLSYNRRKEPKKIELKPEEVLHKEVIITANKILRHVKDFLFQGNESLSSYITIWIERRGIRQNLFKLRKNKTELRLQLSENGFFELNVIIEDGSEKNNLIKNFQLNYQGYKRLKNNIDKVIQESKEEEVGGDQNSSRPIDIAYFFADPLVAVYKKGTQKKLTTTSQNEVSYQVEYDQFIEMIKKEQFRLNFRVEMMVATQTNIKNTLIEGASLLHFACHGDSHGCLQVQNEKLIGQLASLNPERFMDLLQIKTLPKAIIFNVCYSYDLAKRINQQKKIITIGYKGKVKDQYCEKFTKQFYIGLFRDGRPLRQIFKEIKQTIVQKNPEEGNKLSIFPEDEISADEFKLAEPKAHYKEYVIRWSMLESLRANDCLGVKKEMHQFIQKLINDERMSYMFLEGDKNSGKTSLISKIKIYVLNRKTFTDQLVFDLKKPNGQLIETMLELRLAIESSLIAWRSEMLKKAKERRVACLVVLDHVQKIMAFQYGELTAYIQEQLRDKIKYGKIVIITRLQQPLGKRDALSYSRANKHTKKPAAINQIQYSNFVSRYWDNYKQQAQRLTTAKSIAMIDLVKAIKIAHSPSRLEEAITTVRNSPPSPQPKFIEQHEVFQEYIKLNSETERLLKDIDIEVAENHHLYISTILQQIADRIHINKNPGNNRSQSKEQLRQKKMEEISSLVDKFKDFYQRIILHQQTDAIHSFKKITRLSLKIAGLCYLFDCQLQRQLLSCEKMYVMGSVMLLSPFFQVPKVHRRQSQGEQEFMSTNIEGRQLEQLLKQYKLKVLLTLFTYYTQCSFKLLQNEELNQQRQQFLEDKSNKVEIALDELYRVIQKRSKEHQIEIKQTFIKKYSHLNHIIQQLRYSPDSSHLIKPHQNRNRKNSDVGGLYNNMTDVQPLIQAIHSAHNKIEQYWKFYEQLKDANSSIEILSKDSIVIVVLSLIKLISLNQGYLQSLESIGQNYVKRQMHGYFALYLRIMQWIDESQIFAKETKSHSEYVIWQFPNMRSIKELFRRYFRMYIDVYFHVEKLYQNLTKKYQIKIFNQLLLMCVSHPKIKLQSLKKEIENHKDQQFLSNYNCSTFIALPLLKFKSLQDNHGNRVNLKRYQSHIYRFQEQFFSTLDRQIKHDIYSLSRDFFTMDQQKDKSLIQLIILNCSDSAMECESRTGKGEILRIRHITCVPKAPVVILFGFNVKGLIGTFRTLNNCSVLITIDLGSDQSTNERDFLEKNVTKQNFKLKEQRIDKLQQYSSKLQISYSVLQFFYTSFCKHFFSVDHAFFIEQVKNSYHLAKAEAFMKTKIRLQTSTSYGYSEQIRKRIENIQLSVSQQTLQQMRSKPAYHFMFKQYRLQHLARTLTDLTKKDKREMQSQIGCNRQICQLLDKIVKAQKSCNFVYLYKSKQMLEFFQNTLITKLKKYKTYEIILADLVAPDSLDLSRTSSSGTVYKSKVFDLDNQQEAKDHNKKIMIFQDLKDAEFEEEVKMISNQEPITIRLFFTNFRYKWIPSELNEECIMENYNNQKIEFELYFIECKARRPDLSGKNAMKAFKKVIDQQYASVNQIKRELQGRNH